MCLLGMNDRCDSCHGQAEKLLDAAKEMEDSIGVNLRFVNVLSHLKIKKRFGAVIKKLIVIHGFCSSRRLEVSRLELLLQVGTFCSALGALVAGT